jgi:hypothetical protein
VNVQGYNLDLGEEYFNQKVFENVLEFTVSGDITKI